jgi:S-(hydroxymethyl)glutathione dehydrogenase/alcohol dehydrogenase
MRTRAAVLFEPGRPLEVHELDVEEPRPDEVVVRMAAVGICGTDLHSYLGEWDRPTPIVLGHEGAGVVEAVGDDVSGIATGDRVVLSWAPACGECGACRRGRPAACSPLSAAIGRGTLLGGRTGLSLDGETVYRGTATGALAERVVVAAGAALPLGADVPVEQAALLGCAALTGVGAVLNAARPGRGFSALVIGAGGVGQFVVQGARIAGAAAILAVDPVQARREQALRLGATHVCAPDELREAVRDLDPEGVDYAFDAVGAPETTALALRWTRGGGTAVIVGLAAAGARLSLDPLDFTNREKTLTGTIYGSEDPAVALPRLLELVRAGQLELAGLVGPSFSLDDAEEAFRASLAGVPGRVLVTP